MDGLVIWVTGLPGSGKSSVADGIKEHFPAFVILRMDSLRKIVTPEPSYSEQERDLVYRSIVYMAKTLSELGTNVIIDATGNMRKWRDLARQLIPYYAEIYLKCPLPVCAERETARKEKRGAPEDIYKKGLAGWPVPGVHAPYEEPLTPDLVIEMDKSPLKESLSVVYEFITKRLADLRHNSS